MHNSAKSALLLAFAALLFPAPAPAQDADFGSSDYIRSLFPFNNAATVKLLQPVGGFGTPRLAGSALACPGVSVMPASPGQFTKKYHIDAVVNYDNTKTPGGKAGNVPPAVANKPGILTDNETICKVAATNGSKKPDGSYYCLATKTGRYVVMSDLFYCANGGDITFYRGYWEGAAVLANFGANPNLISEEEHILTTSLGRGDSNIQREGYRDFVAGPTFAMERSRFLFFSPATQEDIVAIDAAVSKASGPQSTYIRCGDGHYATRGGVPCAK